MALVYLESFISWEWRYISNVVEYMTFADYLNQLRVQKPKLQAICTAWHYIPTYPDEVRQTKIDYRKVDYFPTNQWEAGSEDPSILNLNPCRMTRIKLLKSVRSDKRTMNAFAGLQCNLVEAARRMYPNSLLSRNVYVHHKCLFVMVLLTSKEKVYHFVATQ